MIEYTVKVYPDGGKLWYLNGELHREDGPAREWANGTKIWHLNGELHREDGPAIEYADGAKEWYLNGKKVTEEEHRLRALKAKAKAKELTVQEISDLLGYEVKVVR